MAGYAGGRLPVENNPKQTRCPRGIRDVHYSSSADLLVVSTARPKHFSYRPSESIVGMSAFGPLRDISRHRINSVAFGAKWTFNEPQSAGPIYEYAP